MEKLHPFFEEEKKSKSIYLYQENTLAEQFKDGSAW